MLFFLLTTEIELCRTGQVHVLWLAAERDYGLEAAIRAVKVQRRTPLTAATREDLRRLLEAVRG